MTPFDEAKPVICSLVDRLLAQGFRVSVFANETWQCRRSASKTDILESVFFYDDESTLQITDNGRELGSVWISLDKGCECVANYSNSLEKFI